jgi:hypothetical protein
MQHFVTFVAVAALNLYQLKRMPISHYVQLFTDKRENAVPHTRRHGHLKMKVTLAVRSYIGV